MVSERRLGNGRQEEIDALVRREQAEVDDDRTIEIESERSG